ncbi:MAG: hypothetical protein WBI44_03865 [Syntrophaceticus sp.]
MERKYSRLLIYGLLIIVFAGGYFLWQEQVVARRALPEGAKIFIKTNYELCKHEDCKETSPLELKVFTLREIRQLYPSREGWQSHYEDNQVMVSRTLEKLCEKCSRVTHLGEKGGFIAVVRGPAGVNGGIIRVTKIKVNTLPQELRKKAEKGLLDLPDEEALLQVLDSLEESGS